MNAAGQPSEMGQVVGAAVKEANRHPDLVLSAHAQLYTRYMRNQSGRKVPYVVAGTGGYWALARLMQFIPWA